MMIVNARVAGGADLGVEARIAIEKGEDPKREEKPPAEKRNHINTGMCPLLDLST